GLDYLIDDWQEGVTRRISLDDAIMGTSGFAVAVHESTEQFYVIDLGKLRMEKPWTTLYDTFFLNAKNAVDKQAPAAHFERLLLNIIRPTRYPPKSMTPAQ